MHLWRRLHKPNHSQNPLNQQIHISISFLKASFEERIGLGGTIHYIEGIFKEEMDDKSLILSNLKVTHKEKITDFKGTS